jgi:hypothetical protein
MTTEMTDAVTCKLEGEGGKTATIRYPESMKKETLKQIPPLRMGGPWNTGYGCVLLVLPLLSSCSSAGNVPFTGQRATAPQGGHPGMREAETAPAKERPIFQLCWVSVQRTHSLQGCGHCHLVSITLGCGQIMA